jgi:predicted DsbA family dithiol-disulfide isomerase
MTKQIALEDLLSRIAARRAALGLDAPEVDEMMRNSGTRRTSEKRAALRQIEARARSAGVHPVPGKF